MINGKLTGLHLGDLLQWLQVGGLSGRLSFKGRWERHLDFLDGRIVYVASESPRERLAGYLVRRGLIPAEEARTILSRSILQRKLLTEELVEQREISRVELQEAVTDLAGIIMRGILSESELHFSFDPEYATRDLLNLDLNLDANSLLLEAARRLDEDDSEELLLPGRKIPFEGEHFESFFLRLVSRGISEEEGMGGQAYVEAHSTIQQIMQILARWLATGPGLVPMTAGQIESLRNTDLRPGFLDGKPQLVWNLLVLASTIPDAGLPAVKSLDELLELAGKMNVVGDLAAAQSWRRPENPPLDQLGSEVSQKWAEAAAAAAAPLDLPSPLAALGAHILSVPTDLVLWVLGSVGIRQRGLRQALLEQLPEILGQALSSRASFPKTLQSLFFPPVISPLGAALEISRSVLPSASLWPDLLGGDSGLLFEHLDANRLREASEAIRKFRDQSVSGL